MSGDRKKVLPDNIPNIGFNLKSLEKFVLDKGIIFEHWAAIPSPIGLKDRGDYRRSDSLDTISENGFIYTKVGEFTGAILGNGKRHDFDSAGAGIYDNSTGRVVIPKFYNCSEKSISLLPGDRIYAKDVELKVDNYQRAEFNPKSVDYLQFPAKCVSLLIDSNNIEYTEGNHFKINKDGNIKWLAGKKNPGIDPDTGEGRIYSVRYTYVAFWYISQLINEIRITNSGTNKEPERMPYHAQIQREYIYHNRTRGDKKDTNEKTETTRTTEETKEKLDPNKHEVKVDIRNFSE